MPGLEEMLSSVLNDPASMSKIMSLAQSLGGAMPQQTAPADSAPDAQDTQPQSAQPQSAQPEPAAQEAAAQTMQKAAQSLKPAGSREAALLRALAPYLKPSRREKIDKVLQIVQLTQLASSTMQSFVPHREAHPHV